MTDTDPPYGVGDASFQAAGGREGIFKLVNEFFDRMGSDDRFATIWDMHPDDKEMSRDKLTRFLCGWLGGPKLYHEKYGSIGIPRVHAHLPPQAFAWFCRGRRFLQGQGRRRHHLRSGE